MSFGARARIRLGAIRHNLQTIKAAVPDAAVMAVIKANAYGHGLLPVARVLEGADSLAVARLVEARALRQAQVAAPIVLLSGVICRQDLEEAAALDLQLIVHDERQIGWLERHRAPWPVVWLKVDTGMNRLGISPDVAAAFLDRLRNCVRDVHLMTHFSAADDPDDGATLLQLERLAPLLERFSGGISVANSPGLFAFGDHLASLSGAGKRQVWIRPGVALYGISPFASRRGTDLGLRPAMQFEATMICAKRIRAGDRVGYGGTWTASDDTVLGVVAAGYGDGYSRSIPSGTPVLVNGRRVPVAGRISMDLMTIDLGPGATDKAGDLVVLWGDGLPVEEIASHAGTVPYQLVTGLMHREASLFEGTGEALPGSGGGH